jgi:3-oxoacyl-(acyl-carrier-protein) synthase
VEPIEDARARGARIHGEYLGGGFNQEGWKVTIPDFSRPWHEEAIRSACARAGADPRSIDAVVAHGAGTLLSDAYEAKGITAVFGKRPERPAVTSLKGHFGHALGASALLETAALLLGLGRGVLPGTAGFQAEDPKLDLVPSARSVSRPLTRVLKVANGFAGFNAAAIFERVVS